MSTPQQKTPFRCWRLLKHGASSFVKAMHNVNLKEAARAQLCRSDKSFDHVVEYDKAIVRSCA